MLAVDVSLIHLTITLLRGLLLVLICIKIVLYALKSVLKYAIVKSFQFFLWIYHYDHPNYDYGGKLDLKRNSHNKSVLSLSVCAVTGLIINKQINMEPILMFICGLVSWSFRNAQPKFCARGKVKICHPQIFSKMMSATNILIVFSLDLIQLTFRCGKPFFDPIVPKLSDSICCNNVRATTIALKCISIVISKHMSLEFLDTALSIFGTIFFVPVQSVLKSIVNILWNNQKKKYY